MRELELFAPKKYWETPADQVDKIDNGCGPKGIIDLVPDKPAGFDFTGPCRIHDWGYSQKVGSEENRNIHDRIFKNNMIRVVEWTIGPKPAPAKKWYHFRQKMKVLKWTRRKDLGLDLAQTYYTFVNKFGGPAYWANKNKKENMG